MSDARRHSGQFRPGVSGNPGGNVRSAEVTALARRYTVDAVRAFVETARITDPKYASARVAAAKELLAIAFPKGAEGGGVVNHLHLHLLAVSQANGASQAVVSPHLTGEPDQEAERESAETAVDRWLGTPGLYPEPDDLEPGEALPLWDSYRARRPTIEGRAEPPAAENTPETTAGTDSPAKSDTEGET
jgi:hypothetical protein